MTIEEFAKLQVEKLEIGHGDLLLVRVPDNFTDQQTKMAGDALHLAVERFRAQVLLFRGDVQFKVVKEAAA